MSETETIVLWKLKETATDIEMDIKTPYITREKQITQTVKCPLYRKGVIISDEELAELGLERVGYTQAQLDEITYTALYEANPDLAPRVRTYKSYLDGLDLSYTATSDEITESINANIMLSDTEKLELGTAITTCLHDIEVNLTLMDLDGQTAWAIMPLLIAYLPEESELSELSEESDESETTEEQ